MASRPSDKAALLRRSMDSVDERFPGAACMGLSFCLAWKQVACPVLLGAGLAWAPASDGAAVSACVRVAVGLAMALAVIAGACFERRVGPALGTPRFTRAALALSFFGTAAMLASLALSLPLACLAAACVVAGWGTGMLLLRAMGIFGGLPPQRVLLLAAASWALAFSMDLMFRNASVAASVPLFCLMPVVAAAFLSLPARRAGEGARGARAASSPRPLRPSPRPPRSFWQFVLTVFLIALVAETVVYFSSYDEGVRLLSMRRTDVAVAVIAGLLVAFAALFPASFGYTRLYHLVVLVVMGLLGLLIAVPRGGSASLVASLTAYQCFGLLVWCLLCLVTHQSRLPALEVLGYGYGLQLLGSVTGFVLGQSLDAALGAEKAAFLPAYLVATMIALAVALAAYPPRAMRDVLAAIPDEDVEGGAREPADAWARAGERLAAEGGLTAREREVMLLLARGRGSLYISERLGIELSTVYTHTRNLYRKLDVHSREELMRAIDARAGDGGPAGDEARRTREAG